MRPLNPAQPRKGKTMSAKELYARLVMFITGLAGSLLSSYLFHSLDKVNDPLVSVVILVFAIVLIPVSVLLGVLSVFGRFKETKK